MFIGLAFVFGDFFLVSFFRFFPSPFSLSLSLSLSLFLFLSLSPSLLFASTNQIFEYMCIKPVQAQRGFQG